MQIGTNLFYDRSTTQLAGLSERADRLQTEIATGKKLLAPSDDAVSYQRLEGLTRTGADDKAWAANITTARTLLEQTDTLLDSVNDRIQQAQELTIQANNGTLSDSDRTAIAGQVRALIDDLVALANTTDVRGQPLFAGATGATAVNRSAAGVVSFAGTGDPAAIPVADGLSIQPTVAAERIFGGLTTTSGATDVFGVLANLATALETPGSAGTVGGFIGDLKSALDQVNFARGSAGARNLRLDLESSRLQDAKLTRETSRSAIEDTDITSAIAELQKTITVLQATQASFTKLTELSLFNYLR